MILILALIVALAGIVMVTATPHFIATFANGLFPRHHWSDAKVHTWGLALVGLSLLLMAALIASLRKRRGGPRL